MKKILSISLGLSLLVSSLAVNTATANSPACGGHPGVQVWKDANRTGQSAVWCSTYTSHDGWQIRKATLPVLDRLISSVQTFNSLGRTLVLYPSTNYSYPVDSSGRAVVVRISGNQILNCLCEYWIHYWGFNSSFNDRTRSLRTL